MYEVEESDSVGDETVEETFEVRQKHRRHVNSVRDARLKKIPRTQNLADMLTHTPSAKELEMFLPLMSLRRCSERDKELMTSRRYKPVPAENLKVYSHG